MPLRLSRTMARLTPAQARAFVTRLADLLREFEGQTPDDEAEAQTYALMVAFYPAPRHDQSPPDALTTDN